MIETITYENENSDTNWNLDEIKICPITINNGEYYVSVFMPSIEDKKITNQSDIVNAIGKSASMAFFYGIKLTEEGFVFTGKKYIPSPGYKEV